ncbi:MAG: UDP-N-acetylglucosamine 1-carboxyvinyltransferase [Clostridia bacterium]|nr:UDP-N-acetylglucosamine 1-carboxyvinyltransferase [Clostridia bacterium]
MKNKEKFIIKKTEKLSGTIESSGSKNAAIPILAASLLCPGKTVLKNVPDLTDITVMCEILTCLGARVDVTNKNEITIDSTNLGHVLAPYDLTSKMRGSFLVMGPLLARMKNVRLSLPGGCPIGSRPVDLHLKGFSALGANITKGFGFAEVSCNKLCAAKIYLDFPSVGATENVLMAAVLADGTTTIENAAAEPEIADLANFLNSMGADIHGAGTDSITVHGVEELKSVTYTIMPDRIEAGSFLIASAICRGDVTVTSAVPSHLKPLCAKLEEIGADVYMYDNAIRVVGKEHYISTDVMTLPFPGFPTDMQAQFMSLLSVSEGTGIVTETIFENRFMHAAELCRMGADIKIEGRCAIVEGTDHLTGAKVVSSDLRAGAALVIAGLCAKGTTEVLDIYHIDRGYENLDGKLRMLGADISRVPYSWGD